MNYETAKPSAPLSEFIRQYWTMDGCIPEGGEHIQRIVPSGLIELIFYFNDKPVAACHDRAGSDSTLITGQLNRYFDLRITGRLSLFSIVFHPHGLSAFLDLPVQELCDRSLPLTLVFGKDVAEMEERLFEAVSFAERIALMEDYFYTLVRHRRVHHSSERIRSSLQIIHRARGLAGINELASAACYSRKQFERIFSQQIGTSPKQFLRIIRFQHAIGLKSADQNLNLSDLTYQCGYYDQAHMNRDFQMLSGMTPRQYFSHCEPYSDYFQ